MFRLMSSANQFAIRGVIPDPARREERLARIEQMENQVFEKAADVVNGLLSFRDIAHDQQEPPEAWVLEYGPEEAKKMLALAKAGWLPQSLMPAGAMIALRAMTGIARSRGYKVKVTQNNLNVKISLPAPTTADHPGPVTYEVRELEP